LTLEKFVMMEIKEDALPHAQEQTQTIAVLHLLPHAPVLLVISSLPQLDNAFLRPVGMDT
jgi:hypothetical protein